MFFGKVWAPFQLWDVKYYHCCSSDDKMFNKCFLRIPIVLFLAFIHLKIYTYSVIIIPKELWEYIFILLISVLEAAPYKTAAVWPLTSHLINHQTKTSKTCCPLLAKWRWIYEQRSPMNTPVLADLQKLIFISCVQTLDTI